MIKLGKDEASILGGDDESDVLWALLEICGFDTEKYMDLIEDDDHNPMIDELPSLVPIKEKLDDQLLSPYSSLNVLLNQCRIGYLEFLILGAFILKTGAVLPQELKAKILKTAEWKTDKWRWEKVPEKFRMERKKNLQEFHSKIESYVDGHISASESDFW